MYNATTIKLATGDIDKRTLGVGAHFLVALTTRLRVGYALLSDKSDATLRNANGALRDNHDARQISLGVVRDLSKRTALYGTYARITHKGSANYFVSGGTAPNAGERLSGLELGVRHSF